MNVLIADDTRSEERRNTSANGAMGTGRPIRRHFLVLMFPPSIGTGSITGAADLLEHLEIDPLLTCSGHAPLRAEGSQDTGSAVLELRRLSGLTWDQLARLFGVARRSVHFWASGKPLNAANEEQLHRALAVVRAIDRGSAGENRTLLFRAHDGLIPFDLLGSGRYDEVIALIGRGFGRAQPRLRPLSPEAQAARAPLPPDVLVDALHDAVHRDVGRGRPARTAKVGRRGRR